MTPPRPQKPMIAELFVCGPVAMLIWSKRHDTIV